MPKVVPIRAPESANMKRKVCFLCGGSEHELPSCPVRNECVLVCREWGSGSSVEALQPPPTELQEALRATLRSELGFELKRDYWHKGVCYVHLGSEDEAQRLLSSLGPRGRLSIGSEVLVVRIARSTKQTTGSAGGVVRRQGLSASTLLPTIVAAEGGVDGAEEEGGGRRRRSLLVVPFAASSLTRLLRVSRRSAASSLCARRSQRCPTMARPSC